MEIVIDEKEIMKKGTARIIYGTKEGEFAIKRVQIKTKDAPPEEIADPIVKLIIELLPKEIDKDKDREVLDKIRQEINEKFRKEMNL